MLRQVLKVLVLLGGLVLLPGAAFADTVAVVLDQAKILRLPEKVTTIVIGNPSIADGTLQNGGLLVVTGKSYGTTNLMALDIRGNILAEHTLNVTAPRDATLTVYRGAERETWSCVPKCERTVVPGDAAAFFDAAVGQAGTRNGMAAGAPAAAPAR